VTGPSQMIEVRPGYFRASWPMAAAAVVLDEKDRVLLVQPVYYADAGLCPAAPRSLLKASAGVRTRAQRRAGD
jgi:hypothetical protein